MVGRPQYNVPKVRMTKSYYLELEGMICLHQRHIFILNVEKSKYKILSTGEAKILKRNFIKRGKRQLTKLLFLKVCEVVSKEVMSNQTVIKLTNLVQLYVKELEGTDFPNPNCRSEKLKDRLESRYGQQIAFCKLDTTGLQCWFTMQR